MGLAIALTGLVLPLPILVLADSCGMAADGCLSLARSRLARTPAELYLLWNLALGWTHVWLGGLAWIILRRDPAGWRAVALAWGALMLTKGAGPVIGVVEQGHLLLPVMTGVLDALVIATLHIQRGPR